MKLPSLGKALSAYPRKNVLTPLLWLSGITFPITIAAYCFLATPKDFVALALGFSPVLMTLYFYSYWARKDANRLQTEGFRIQLEAYARMQPAIGDAHSTIEIREQTKLIGNPSLNQDTGNA